MLDSGKFSDQIKRGFSKDKPPEVQAKEQGTMWSRFLPAIGGAGAEYASRVVVRANYLGKPNYCVGPGRRHASQWPTA